MTVTTALVSRTRLLPEPRDPLQALGPDGFAWFRDGAGVATAGVVARIPVPPGPGRIRAAAEQASAILAAIETDDAVDLPATGPIVVGALPFSDHTPGELIVPALVVGCTADGQAWITETGTGSDLGRSGYGDGPEPTRSRTRVPEPARLGEPWGRRPDRAIPGRTENGGEKDPPRLVFDDAGAYGPWKATVNRALQLIADGAVTKVVVARRLDVQADRDLDVRSVVGRLRASQPTCWTYAAGTFVGASPELLVRRIGGWVESRPMAGTVAQGLNGPEDERLVSRLESSPKERAEHTMVVDDVIAALEPVCREVFAHTEPQVVRLATVAHLATTVAGRLHDPAPSALALAGRLHPTPAVGGLPRPQALAAIAEMEDFDRGRYAGPVGWVDRHGDGEWAVALRGADLRGDRAVLTAGAGIVSDSDPDAEWAETRAKLEAMLGALSHNGDSHRPE